MSDDNPTDYCPTGGPLPDGEPCGFGDCEWCVEHGYAFASITGRGKPRGPALQNLPYEHVDHDLCTAWRRMTLFGDRIVHTHSRTGTTQRRALLRHGDAPSFFHEQLVDSVQQRIAKALTSAERGGYSPAYLRQVEDDARAGKTPCRAGKTSTEGETRGYARLVTQPCRHGKALQGQGQGHTFAVLDDLMYPPTPVTFSEGTCLHIKEPPTTYMRLGCTLAIADLPGLLAAVDRDGGTPPTLPAPTINYTQASLRSNHAVLGPRDSALFKRSDFVQVPYVPPTPEQLRRGRVVSIDGKPTLVTRDDAGAWIISPLPEAKPSDCRPVECVYTMEAGEDPRSKWLNRRVILDPGLDRFKDEIADKYIANMDKMLERLAEYKRRRAGEQSKLADQPALPVPRAPADAWQGLPIEIPDYARDCTQGPVGRKATPITEQVAEYIRERIAAREQAKQVDERVLVLDLDACRSDVYVGVDFSEGRDHSVFGKWDMRPAPEPSRPRVLIVDVDVDDGGES